MVMVPPEGRSVCVVKVTVVTAVVACSGFWSAAASVNTGGWPPAEIAPDATPAEARVSWSVCTVMPAEPAFTAPMVRPLRVMVKAVAAAIPVVAVVMTMAVAVGWAEVAVMVPTDVVPAALTAGVAVVAKNPDG